MKTLACTLVAVVVTAWGSAAVALDVTFDDVMSVGNPPLTMLDTHGYRFTGAFRTIDAPGGALVSNASAVYLGQEASGPGITVARTDGGAFLLYDFDAAGLYVAPSPGSPNAQQVSLAGFRVDLLVTVGSPLGIGNIQQHLRDGAGRPNPVPKPVRAWSNFADRFDPVAIEATLRDEFDPPKDFATDTGVNNAARNNHDLPGYLSVGVVRQTIADAAG